MLRILCSDKYKNIYYFVPTVKKLIWMNDYSFIHLHINTTNHKYFKCYNDKSKYYQQRHNFNGNPLHAILDTALL